MKVSDFAKWCGKHGIAELPAEPSDVARFVREHASLGATKVFIQLGHVSRAHHSIGVQDPVKSPVVSLALRAIGKIDAPRSWSKEMQVRFYDLPIDMQAYILQRQLESDAALRRAQNEAAASRKEIA